MDNKYLYKTDESCIAIKDGRMYIISTKYKDYSIRAVTVVPGFQIELGRNINEIEEALKETRLPVILKSITANGNSDYYQVIRMHTGKVDDKIVATIICKDKLITSISFNRKLLRDGNYRRYNQLSVFHQISIPYELGATEFKFRRDQVTSILKSIISLSNAVEINESNKQLEAIINEDNQHIKFMFILNKDNNRYELASISLQN